MAMVATDIAKKLADGMKSRGLFDVPTADGDKYNADVYNSTLENLEKDWAEIISYLQSNMDVIGVATTVTTAVATAGSAAAQTGTGSGTGTQSNKGKVL